MQKLEKACYVSSWKLLLPLISICCFCLRDEDAHKVKLYTMLSLIKVCTVFHYVLKTLSDFWPRDIGKKGIPTFLRALFIFILTKKLQPLPHSSCPGPMHHLWAALGGLYEEGKRETGGQGEF